MTLLNRLLLVVMLGVLFWCLREIYINPHQTAAMKRRDASQAELERACDAICKARGSTLRACTTQGVVCY